MRGSGLRLTRVKVRFDEGQDRVTGGQILDPNTLEILVDI